ncbi:MAG: hypothetical protein IT434_09660 [Phycisphaerales bacterium]|jgi:hypothetical protein|nr:hypothetical protein [Phycisphaerales bacterium]
MTVILGVIFLAGSMAQVTLRDGSQPGSPVEAVSIEGVRVGGALLGLDRVKSVEGEFARAWGEVAGAADEAWRVRQRFERGDLAGAEVIAEALLTRLGGKQGPTTAMVAEALTRVRVKRGSQTGALESWLMWYDGGSESKPLPSSFAPDLASRRAVLSDRWPTLSIDGASGLLSSLPPIWINVPSVQAWVRAGEKEISSEARRSAAYERLYRAAARFEVDGTPVDIGGLDLKLDGPKLVSEIVLARAGDTNERESARRDLLERLEGSPPAWLEAWVRAAIGRSMLKEEDPEVRRRGVLHLLHVPARLTSDSPYLAGVALAESARALLELGDRDGAEVIRAELMRDYPAHPALDWWGVRDWPARGGSNSVAAPAAGAHAGGTP